MAVPQRRRKEGEPLHQVVGTPATVPTATGEIPQWVGTRAIEPSHEEIARRAYQLYEERGGGHGHDQDDWFQAERELRRGLHDLADRMLEDSHAVA